MIQFRRLVSVLLGLWLGAGILTDIAVTQNFATVDRFLQTPGSVATSIELNRLGRDSMREILRRNAAEENNAIFDSWELCEIAIGCLLFLLILFGDRPQVNMLALSALMTVIVLIQHFALSPQVATLGRAIVGLPKEAEEVKRFWMLHGFYSGSELLKLGIGLLFVLRLVLRRKQDPDHFKKEYEANARSGMPAAVGKLQ